MPDAPTPQPPPALLDFTDLQAQAHDILAQLVTFTDARVGGRHMSIARTHMEDVVYRLGELPGNGQVPPTVWPPPA
jgi:hypothetical protein